MIIVLIFFFIDILPPVVIVEGTNKKLGIKINDYLPFTQCVINIRYNLQN